MFESGHFMFYVSCHPIGGIYLLCVLKIWILCLSVVCHICRVAGMIILMCLYSMDLLMWLFRPFTNFTSDHISDGTRHTGSAP